jgi:NADH-quinone oxidoreductase subunit C
MTINQKTKQLNAEEVAGKIAAAIPSSVTSSDKISITINPKFLYEAAKYLKDVEEFDFNFLSDITSVDYEDYFEVVYHLVSLTLNHLLTLRIRIFDKVKPEIPSVVTLWRSADFQEREIYDLMGITFSRHPNMKRLLLWEGFEGHPLRKDYL